MAEREASPGGVARQPLGWLLVAIGWVLVAYGATRLAVVLGSVLTEPRIRIGWLWDLGHGPTREIIERLILAVAPLIAGVAVLRRWPQARSLAIYLCAAAALLGAYSFVFMMESSPGAVNFYEPIRQPFLPWHQQAGVILLAICAVVIAIAGGPLTPPRPPAEITRPVSARSAPFARPVGLLLFLAGLAQVVFIVPADGLNGGGWFDAWFNLYLGWRMSPSWAGDYSVLGPLLLFWSAGVGLATLVSGVGLFMRKAWARPLGLVTCAFGAWTYFLLALVPYGVISEWRRNLAIAYLVALVVGFITFLAFRPRRQTVLAVPGVALPVAPDIVSTIPAGEGWRDALIRSLTADGVSEPPRPRRLRRLLGWPALIGGLLVIGVARIALPRAVAGQGDEILWFVAWALVASLLLVPLLHFAARNVRRARANSAVKELKKPDGRRPILYLRPFEIDVEISRRSAWEFLPLSVILPVANAEETAVRDLSGVGPVITIGRPGEPLPALGAARFYVSDDAWRGKVADAASVAQRVLLVSGVSDGLRWEVAFLLRTVPMEKLILWAHPWLLGLGKRDREREWTFFRIGPGSLFPKPLPEVLGDTRFFSFTAEGEPIPARSLAAILNPKP